jgi:hypothetical protein
LEFLLGLSIGFGPPVASSLQFLFSTEFLYMSIGEAVPAPFFSSDTQENCRIIALRREKRGKDPQ